MSAKRSAPGDSESGERKRGKKAAAAAGGGGPADLTKWLPEVCKEAQGGLIQLRKVMETEDELPALTSLGLKDEVIQVDEMDDPDVKTAIEEVMLEIAASILAGRGFGFKIPSRTSTSQLYVSQLDRMVLKKVLKDRVFANTSQVRKTTITTRVLELIHQVVSKQIHITKRDLFYTDVKLFGKQEESDSVLDDIACMIGCTRTSLNVVASDKGVVVGRVTFLEDGDHIDCTKMGVGGKAIPALVHKITNIKSDAQFILLVEKDAAFMRLAEDRFYNKYPCIIVTGKGQPDVASRLFLRMLKQSLKIPILALMDSDPHGIRIMCTYMKSSKAMSYDSDSLATGDIKWLGVRPSDLNKYKIPEQCRLDMDEKDVKEATTLLDSDFIIKNSQWVQEIEMMIKMKKKAEIQALSSFGFQYLTEEYLPAKIKAGDWI